jgi:hypothetical protein
MVIRIYKSSFSLIFGLLFTLPVFSQTLTISSAGNSGSYSYSAGTLTLSGNATLTATQIVSWLSTSSLTILGSTNAISVDVNQDINSTVAGNGLTIGNTNSTGTVTFNNTVSLMGALTVYANSIRMGSAVVANSQSAQLLAGGSSGSISLLAKNGFESLATTGTTRGKIMTTGGGNIHINADTDANNSGQLNIDWLTFDSGTGNIILEASSYSWSTSSSVELPEFYGTGAFTFRNVPNANHVFSLAWIAIFQNRSELTLGSNTGSEEILFAPCSVCHFSAKNYTGATLETNGPINLYGSKVTLDLSIKAVAANADILLKAKNSIVVNANRTITSNNGDITLWANADGTANATDGDFIGLQNAVVINSANGSTNQATGGGTITMAGGTTTQTLVSGTIVPTGYAYSNRTTFWGPLLPPGGVNFGFSTAANNQQNSLSIYSGGGDVVIKGKSHSSSAGIQWFSGMTGASQVIHSGNGTILFDGAATSSDAHGIELNSYAASGGVTPNITSSSPLSSAIRFVGETAANAGRAGFQGAATIIANATGGGIEISGKTPSASTYGAIEAGGIQTYALTGPITFIGEGSGGLKIGGTWGKGSLASSSSNIVMRSDVFTLNNPTIQTTGTITVEPLGASFTNAISYPITGLSLPNTISGLTIGKDQNTANVTFASNTSVAGPITVYGGQINVNQNLTTTGGASGDVLLKATSNIIEASAKVITTAGGDVTLWADSDNNGAGYIYISGGTNSGITSGGGAISLGGGADLSTGYARGADELDGVVAAVKRGGIQLCASSVLQSGGGNITLRGQNSGMSTGGVHAGIMTFGTTIDAGNGKIAIYGKATGSGTANAQGISREGNDNWIIRSSNAASDAIQLIGDASGCNGSATSLGINFIGTIEATGGGGILLHGTAGTGTAYDQGLDVRGNVLANSGTITLKGENNSSSQVSVFLGTFSTFSTTLGSKANTNVTASSSPIIIQGDNIDFNTVTPVNSTGTLTIEPVSTSFSSALSFPIANLTVANTIGGLALGKTNNTANITIGAATTVNGPVTLHGGELTLNAGLTTANNATGNITFNGAKLLGAGAIALGTGRTLTANLSGTSEFTGNISGTTIILTKSGAGTLTLNPSNALSCSALNVAAGELAIAASKQLTVTGTLTNNGTFTLKDGATFVQATSGTSMTGTGTYTVEKALSGNSATWNSTTSGRFWYMGVPMSSVARSSFGTQGATTNRVWSYSEATKAYTEIISSTAPMSAGTGYVHRRSLDGTLTFSAADANGLCKSDFPISGLTRTSGSSVGFNLIANPYMAYLDWHAVTKTNVEETYYIRSNNAGSDISALITYNGSNQQLTHNTSLTLTAAQMQYLAPMQAVWVRVGSTSATGSLAMTRSMLSHQTGNPGLKNTGVFPTLARVNLVDGPRYDQLLVFMNEYMTNAVDQNDSEKMFVSGAPQLYTMASGKKLVMNGLKNNKKKISVPLYLELPESKVYNLQLAEYILEDGIILIEDKQEGTIQDFTIHDTYAFYANSGVLQNRFVLHFYMPDAGVSAQGPSNSWVEEESAINEGGSILVSTNGRGKVTIQQDIHASSTEKGSVVVRDAAGKGVYNGPLIGSATIFELNVPSGVYFVEVQLNGQIEMKKIFVQQ